jgi:hypothetical protein
MATQTTTKLVDDLDGGTADRTVTFGWEGHTFEIDLSKKNIAALDGALKPYIEAGRRARASAGRGRPGAAVRRSGARRGAIPDLRQWARANGHEISDRGRISAAVVAAYEAR